MEIMGCPTRVERVVWQTVGDEVVILDTDSSTIRILNETAGFIWALADGRKKIEDIVPDVCDRFEVTPGEAKADVVEFCEELLQAGLISMKDGSHEA